MTRSLTLCLSSRKTSESEYELPKTHIESEAVYSLLDDYKVDFEDVRSFTDPLVSQYRRKKVNVRGDTTHNDIRHAQRNTTQITDKLQCDVDETRAQFRQTRRTSTS